MTSPSPGPTSRHVIQFQFTDHRYMRLACGGRHARHINALNFRSTSAAVLHKHNSIVRISMRHRSKRSGNHSVLLRVNSMSEFGRPFNGIFQWPREARQRGSRCSPKRSIISSVARMDCCLARGDSVRLTSVSQRAIALLRQRGLSGEGGAAHVYAQYLCAIFLSRSVAK